MQLWITYTLNLAFGIISALLNKTSHSFWGAVPPRPLLQRSTTKLVAHSLCPPFQKSGSAPEYSSPQFASYSYILSMIVIIALLPVSEFNVTAVQYYCLLLKMIASLNACGMGVYLVRQLIDITGVSALHEIALSF